MSNLLQNGADVFAYSSIALYLFSFFCASCGAWLIANFAYKFGLVDHPNIRSSHDLPIPKGGGIGILAAFLLSSLILKIPLSFLLPATFLSLVSLLGDKIEIPPVIRLLLQFCAALILIIGAYINQQIPLNFILIGFMAVFIVGTANHYNFMDGINGIAGITGVVGFCLLALYLYRWSFNVNATVLTICMALSCLGFLPFNMPKAKVFMGDVGSILLGFVFAGMVATYSKSVLDFISLSAFLFPFYVDELTTVFIRLRDGENIVEAHRRHFYQILANEQGISHWKISVGYGLAQLIVGTSVLLLKPLGIVPILLLLIFFFSGFVLLSFSYRKRLHTAN